MTKNEGTVIIIIVRTYGRDLSLTHNSIVVLIRHSVKTQVVDREPIVKKKTSYHS